MPQIPSAAATSASTCSDVVDSGNKNWPSEPQTTASLTPPPHCASWINSAPKEEPAMLNEGQAGVKPATFECLHGEELLHAVDEYCQKHRGTTLGDLAIDINGSIREIKQSVRTLEKNGSLVVRIGAGNELLIVAK